MDSNFSLNTSSISNITRRYSIDLFNDGNYHDNSHSKNLLNIFRIYFCNKIFTDQVIIVQGDTFRVHKAILAASSPFFEVLFSTSLCTLDPLQVEIHNIDKLTFSHILTFIYSGEITLTLLNVEDILLASTYLLMYSIQQVCQVFLKGYVDSSNCLGIIHLAERLRCLEILNYATRYLVDNFMDICEHDEFLQLPLSDLLNIISMEDLVVQSELQVLQSCVKWYCFAKKTRLKAMSHIFSNIKLPLIHLEDIKMCLSNDPEILNLCYIAISNLADYNTVQSNEIASQDNQNAFKFIHRRSTCLPSAMYVVGGEINPGRVTANTVQKYDMFKRQWEVCAPMGTPRRGAGVSMARGHLFVVGGSDGHEALASCECYDPRLNSWRLLAPMTKCRSSVSVAFIGNILYALGGYDGITGCLSSVESYNLETGIWSNRCDMASPRSMLAAAVLYDSLYVVGGYDGSSDLSTCEVYCPTANVWHGIAPMLHSRCMAGAVAVNNRVFVVGGCNQAQSLQSVEVYDPDSDVWYSIASTIEIRSGLGVALLGDKICAVGGYNGTDCSTTIETYDPKEDKWSIYINIPIGKRRFGCCS